MARIAIFSTHYRPHVGGIESFTENLAGELALRGDEVTVVTSRLDGSPETELQDDGVKVFRLPSWTLMGGRLPVSRRNSEYRALVDRLVAEDFERVLVNTRFYRHSLEGMRFARRIAAPLVVLDHGSAYLTLGNAGADFILRCYEHVVTALGRRYGPRYAGISAASTRWLAQFGIKTQLVIPNAIDAVAFRNNASTRSFRDELGVRDGQILVVSVGRLAPEKGSLQLAEAAALLGERFVVALAGEGPLRRRIEALGHVNVRLLGNLGHPDLSALLSQADLFCLPSRSEGFCTSLLEAGAWGLFPVMTHVGGTDEVMGDPVEFGRLLPDMSAESIASVLTSIVAEGFVSHDARLAANVKQFCSWPITARHLTEAFS